VELPVLGLVPLLVQVVVITHVPGNVLMGVLQDVKHRVHLLALQIVLLVVATLVLPVVQAGAIPDALEQIFKGLLWKWIFVVLMNAIWIALSVSGILKH
jgi:predicted MFS family arabinose efflux permease